MSFIETFSLNNIRHSFADMPSMVGPTGGKGFQRAGAWFRPIGPRVVWPETGRKE
jgi:hypothetical protein